MNAPKRIFTADIAEPKVSLENRRIRLYIALVIADLLVLGMSFRLVQAVYLVGHDEMAARMAATVVPVFALLAFARRLYSIGMLKKGASIARRVAFCIFVSGMFQILLTFLTKTTAEFSRVVFLGGLLVSFVAITALHLAAAAWFRRRNDGRVRNVLVIDAGGPAIDLPFAFHSVASHLDPKTIGNSPEELDAFGRMVASMDRVIVSCPPEDRRDWAHVLRCAGICGEVTSQIMHDMGAMELRRENGFTSVRVATGPLSLRNRAAKRAMDLVGSIGAIILLSPVFLLAAIAIKLDDGGPIFFRQRRMGQGNVFFNVLKFRSMRAERCDAHGAASTARDDDRITRVGGFLRRTSIDELPQLFNVLFGQMSIVGPRPHATGSRAGGKLFWEVSDDYWRRHALKPGLTGLAQVRGHRGATEQEKDLTDRLSSDLEYLIDWSPLRDITIAARTARVLMHPNAY